MKILNILTFVTATSVAQLEQVNLARFKKWQFEVHSLRTPIGLKKIASWYLSVNFLRLKIFQRYLRWNFWLVTWTIWIHIRPISALQLWQAIHFQDCSLSYGVHISSTILYEPYYMDHIISFISYGAYYMDHIIWTILYGKWYNWLEFLGFSYRDIYIIWWISNPDRGTKMPVWQNWSQNSEWTCKDDIIELLNAGFPRAFEKWFTFIFIFIFFILLKLK